MNVSDIIAKDYLAGKAITAYREEWFFQRPSEGGRVFTEPSYLPEEREKVRTVYRALLEAAETFQPLNRDVWDAIFPSWPDALKHTQADLILGFPQPYDAVALRRNGIYHVVFDLLLWTGYMGKADLKAVARNLLTHESCHALIGQTVAGIDADLDCGAYTDMLDAIVFHEGFAHLVSYDGKALSETDWTAPKLREVRTSSCETLRRALAAVDEAEQENYLNRANCGRYYEKFACMAGMLYLAELWRLGGVTALKECFDVGYHGFAKKCAITFNRPVC